MKIDGSDLREINLTHLRRSFGVVMQDNFLFRGTVRENIIAGRPGLTFEDVIRAARLAGAEEFVERLPRGYETWIEEAPRTCRAARGSGSRSPAPDHGSEIAHPGRGDQRAGSRKRGPGEREPPADRERPDHDHRVPPALVLIRCDQILVLDKGSAIAIGPHDHLVEHCTIYKQLWQQQNRHLEEARPSPIYLSAT